MSAPDAAPIHYCDYASQPEVHVLCGAPVSAYDDWGKPDGGPEACGYTFEWDRVTCPACLRGRGSTP
jgi:hypothetical protein